MHRVCLVFVLFLLSLSNFVSATTFIVLVDCDSKPSVYPTAEHWYEATLQTLKSNTDDPQQENMSINTNHVYNTVCHGFSARLTHKQAAQLKNKTGITAVMPDLVRQLQTTRSPSFLGLYADNNNNVSGRLLSASDSGSNVIIGFIDTGIWPEHPSFGDEGMSPIPSKWRGECEKGQHFTRALCNKKIIGARYLYKGYEEANGKINPSSDFLSARDSSGHGTHTASTAAGRAVANASFFGYAKGTAVGVAPKARIAVYKVCWEYGCTSSDILSALDKAVEDGVDVISISLGGEGMSSNIDPIAIGAFGAMKKGVLVSASAGNDGPEETSVRNVAPWMTTVGSGTIDRSFAAELVLGDGRVLKGSSIYTGKPFPKKNKTTIPIVYGEYCDNSSSLDARGVRGKIVVCNTDNPFNQEDAIKRAGGVAIVSTLPGMHGHRSGCC